MTDPRQAQLINNLPGKVDTLEKEKLSAIIQDPNPTLAGTLYCGGNDLWGVGNVDIGGQVVIDFTHTEALIVRKNNDGGNVFVVDTSNGRVGIGGIPSQALDIVSGSLELISTTTSTTGVIYKGADRFFHDFHHPTGDTVVPNGLNTFIGKQAGNFTMGSTATLAKHGSSNVGLGYRTLFNVTSGFRNVAIGTFASFSNGAGYNNMSLGYASLYDNISGYYNTGIGSDSLRYITGNENVGIGEQAGRLVAAGTNNITSGRSVYLGNRTRAGASGNTNEIVIGYSAIGQGSNTIMLGNSSVTSLLCYDTTITSPSDKRIKKNVLSLDGSVMLDFITELNPITYNKINPKDWDVKLKVKKPKKIKGEPENEEFVTEDNLNTYAGLIAQDVEKAMKKCGVDYELVPHLDNGMLALRYTDFIPALIGAVQELSNKLDVLEKK